MNNTDHHAARRATIARAVEHLRTAPYATVRRQLLDVEIWPHWQRNPAAFADMLDRHATDPEVGRRFGAWKGAQRVLLAAGLPWHPNDYRPAA